uniref:medium-chain acyl-CoA ligase n=1 Tax=Amblyomma maculatum TaxID=34609 RepID=G3MSG9_AMBMU
MIRVVRSTVTRLRPVLTQKFVHARSVSRLQKSLSNNDTDGCWQVVDNPPREFNFSRDIIEFWAAEKQRKGHSDSPAFWFARETSSEPDTMLTFADLSTLSQRVAGFFKQELGLGKGSRLMVMLPKTTEYWLVLLAAIRCGTLLTTCTPMLTAKDVEFRLSKFQPDCIIAGLNEMPTVDEALRSLDSVPRKVLVSKDHAGNEWKLFSSLLRRSQEYEGEATYTDDPALVFFTSGTTGPPKMVEHTHGYYLGHLSTACHVHHPEQHDVSWCVSDTGWAKAAWGTFPVWFKGACVFQAEMPRFLPSTMLAVLRDYPITQLCAPPTVYRTLLHQDPSLLQFRSLKDCISAGEPMNPEVMLKWHSLTGVQVREVYGQSETVVLCAAPKHHPIKPGSMGIPPPNIALQIHDENGKEVAVGETGLIAVAVGNKRPLGLFSCYMDDPERTASAFRNGFYYTGDRASADVDGYFWFYSRADDVIISAGYRIGPFEVESVLVEHPAVVECAVVASPDPDRGEVVKAFVVLRPDYKATDPSRLVEELQQHVKKHTAPYKYPRKVEFVDQLPKTISGKILRHQLREKEKLVASIQH